MLLEQFGTEYLLYKYFFREGKIKNTKTKYSNGLYASEYHYYKNILISSYEAYEIDEFLDEYLNK